MSAELDQPEGTESWMPGFYRAFANYIIQNDIDFIRFRAIPSELQTHMKECSIATVHEIDQDISEEGVFDTFDSNRTRPVSTIAATITCECGKYTHHRIQREADLNDILFGVLHDL